MNIEEINYITIPFDTGKTRLIETKYTFYHYIDTISVRSQVDNIKYFYHNVELVLTTYTTTYFYIPKIRTLVIKNRLDIKASK